MNPTPRSPADVSRDPAYEVMHDSVSATYWPSADHVIVRHKVTGAFWRAVYAVRADDSDYEMSAHWTRVRPEPAPKMVTYVEHEEHEKHEEHAERTEKESGDG
jgi:hypothetical protein